MLLYAYFTPKVDFKRKFNHHQSFLYKWRLTAQTIRKFRIGPSIRIESRIGRTIRNRIESRSFAGPYNKSLNINELDCCTCQSPAGGRTQRLQSGPSEDVDERGWLWEHPSVWRRVSRRWGRWWRRFGGETTCITTHSLIVSSVNQAVSLNACTYTCKGVLWAMVHMGLHLSGNEVVVMSRLKVTYERAKIVNVTSALLGYTVPFMSVYAGKYRTEDRSRTDTTKTKDNLETANNTANCLLLNVLTDWLWRTDRTGPDRRIGRTDGRTDGLILRRFQAATTRTTQRNSNL